MNKIVLYRLHWLNEDQKDCATWWTMDKKLVENMKAGAEAENPSFTYDIEEKICDNENNE